MTFLSSMHVVLQQELRSSNQLMFASYPCRKQEHAAAQAADQAALLAARLKAEAAGAQQSADSLRAQDSALKERIP